MHEDGGRQRGTECCELAGVLSRTPNHRHRPLLCRGTHEGLHDWEEAGHQDQKLHGSDVQQWRKSSFAVHMQRLSATRRRPPLNSVWSVGCARLFACRPLSSSTLCICHVSLGWGWGWHPAVHTPMTWTWSLSRVCCSSAALLSATRRDKQPSSSVSTSLSCTQATS